MRIAAAIPSIRLGRCLGRGGMAVVYEGFDQGFTPPRRIAIKLMDPRLSADPDFRGRFEREASLVAGFRHDNIIHVYASGEAAGAKYIMMEYLGGGTLAEKIAQGPLSIGKAIRVATALAEALDYSHSQGVVHRDFKPGNVMFTVNEKPVLSDFGIAKPMFRSDVELTRHSMVMGAPRYMSPEQAYGASVTDRTDIYSYGLTLLEMLTANVPEFSARVLRSVDDGDAIRAALQSASVPPTVANLICRCLLFEPTERPSAAECARELTSRTSGPSRPLPTSGVWLLGAAGAIVAAAVVIGLVRMNSKNPSTPSAAPSADPSAAAAVPGAKLATLYQQLGISTVPLELQQTYSRSDMLTAIQSAPRHVVLGSTPAQIDAAFNLCKQYSSACRRDMYADEGPREATLAPFQLDATAVSVDQFRDFVAATHYQTDAELAGFAYAVRGNSLRRLDGGNWRNAVGSRTPRRASAVVGVSFRDAQQYCQWKKQRLPTENEWEYAARGPKNNQYPWGDDVTPALTHSTSQPLVTDGPREGSGGASRGLSGQVWEWVDTEIDGRKVLKGGSWLETSPSNRRAATRRYELPSRADADSGFRCATAVSAWPDAEVVLSDLK